MKKLIYTVALVVMGVTASYAQRGSAKQQGTAEERAEKAAVAMQQRLTLTSEQKQKVKDLELDRIKKSDEWRNLNQANMKQKLAERQAFAKANKEKMDAILTPEQKTKVDASRKEMKEKMKSRRADGKGFKGPKGEKRQKNDKVEKTQ